MTAAVSQRDPEPVPFRELVAAEVRAQLARRSMSGRTLARQIHRDQTWVSRRLKAATPMTTDDLDLISSALGMTALQLIAAIPPGAAVSGSSGPTGSPTRQYDRAVGATLIAFPQDRVSSSPNPTRAQGTASSAPEVFHAATHRTPMDHGRAVNCAHSA